MSYATQIHMETRFGVDELVLLSDASGSGVADAAVIAAALAAADEVIDGYVAGRYALPLSPVPGIIVSIACDIARFRLHKDGAPEHVVAAHSAALARLKDIQSGKFILASAGVAAAENSGGGAAFNAPERVFSGGTLKNY